MFQSYTQPIIAPFFADVDTRTYGQPVKYGTGTFEGRQAFGVTWNDVADFGLDTSLRNSFQLLLVDRSDYSPGDFDIIFNYGQIQWDQGSVSSVPAAVGFAFPNLMITMEGSYTSGAFLDGASYSLVSNRLNTSTDDRYVFFTRDGRFMVPEPSKALLILISAGAWASRRQRMVA